MASKGKSKPGANAPGKLLRKHFGGLEIAEATKPLTLFPAWTDFKGATKHDPHNCGFARCAARVTGSSSALFFKQAVYIDHPGPDGVKRAYRYKADIHIYRVLAAFDKGKIKEGDVLREFILKPPPKSASLIAKRKATSRWKKTSFGKASIALEIARQRLSRLTAQRSQLEERLRAAKDRAPHSVNTRELRQEVVAVRQEVMKARDTFDQKKVKMVYAREVNHSTGTPKPRKYDLDVRSGSRYFSQL